MRASDAQGHKMWEFDVFIYGDCCWEILVRILLLDIPSKHLNGILPTDVLLEVDGSMVCKWIIFHLLINGVCWGYNPLILGHPSTYQTPKLRSSY